MIRRYYADVMPDESVLRVFYVDDPDEGPPAPPTGNGTPQYIGTDFVWNAPSGTSKPTWPAGATAIVWAETVSLDDLKARKNAEINEWRATANSTTFPYAGKLIACDALSRSDIDGVANHITLIGTFPDGFPNAWKATDNTYVSIPDIATFKDMYSAMTAQGTANFDRSQQLKAQLADATTAEQVAAIQP